MTSHGAKLNERRDYLAKTAHASSRPAFYSILECFTFLNPYIRDEGRLNFSRCFL